MHDCPSWLSLFLEFFKWFISCLTFWVQEELCAYKLYSSWCFDLLEQYLILSVIKSSIWVYGILVYWYNTPYSIIPCNIFYTMFSLVILGSNFSLNFYWPVLIYPSKFTSCHLLLHNFLNSLVYFCLQCIYFHSWPYDDRGYYHLGSTLLLAECEKELFRVVDEYPESM